MARQLTAEAQADRDDFKRAERELGGCSCHISPPCGHCTHPGNPMNQEDDEFWEEVADEPDQTRAENGCVQYRPQWQERLGWKLYPQKHIDAPELPKGMTKGDVVFCNVNTELSFLDRIRLLISGRCSVSVKTSTENCAGKVVSAAAFNVCPPKWLDRKD